MTKTSIQEIQTKILIKDKQKKEKIRNNETDHQTDWSKKNKSLVEKKKRLRKIKIRTKICKIIKDENDNNKIKYMKHQLRED